MLSHLPCLPRGRIVAHDTLAKNSTSQAPRYVCIFALVGAAVGRYLRLGNGIGFGDDALEYILFLWGKVAGQVGVELGLLLLHFWKVSAVRRRGAIGAVGILTHQGSTEELIRLNLVEWRLEKNAVFTELIIVIVIDSAAKLLSLKLVSAANFIWRIPYFIVKELEIGVALLLGLRGLFLDSRFFVRGLPLALVIVPFIIVIVVRIVARVVWIFTKSFLPVYKS